MVKSMTGFGRAQLENEAYSILIEVKAVNHRYFEPNFRVTRQYAFLEEKLKAYLQEYIARGKVECMVSIQELASDNVTLQINHSLAKAYVDACAELEETYNIRNDLSATNLIRFNDVAAIHKEATDEETIWNVVKPVLAEAVDKFVAMREREGEKLKEDICSKADNILENVAFIEKRSPETVAEYNEKMKQRMRELLDDAKVDETRLLTEAAIYADKVAVDEETVRLHSHIEGLKAMFTEDGAIGRKMDFLVQEINRETNTIGSKCSDFEITSRVLAMKGEIEKIREQVQNIE
ncbi:MAG: YicC family protein [Clostridia bacterium]|nr:YicC family protein [Clostridia bacterium]